MTFWIKTNKKENMEKERVIRYIDVKDGKYEIFLSIFDLWDYVYSVTGDSYCLKLRNNHIKSIIDYIHLETKVVFTGDDNVFLYQRDIFMSNQSVFLHLLSLLNSKDYKLDNVRPIISSLNVAIDNPHRIHNNLIFSEITFGV